MKYNMAASHRNMSVTLFVAWEGTGAESFVGGLMRKTLDISVGY